MQQLNRILNINDNKTSRFTLTQMLQHAGFEVFEADSGAAGLDLARELKPAVILLDIKLPDIDGFEVCRKLRMNPKTTKVPVIHVTAHALGMDKKVKSLEDGAEAYLTFPVDRAYLLALVRSMVRLSRAEAERESFLQRITEKNQELEGTLHALEAERDLKEKFVAMLSHDLRNPLASIKLSSQQAKRKVAQVEEVNRHLDKIIRTVERADQMIQDLLDVSLLRAGQKIPLRIIETDIETDIRQIAKEVGEEVTAQFGNPVVLNAPPISSRTALWDPRAIRRVLENLLQNAAKYGSPGGTITISVLFRSDSIQLTVHNWGEPIDQENKAGLFAAFERSDSAKQKGAKGWGLGLTLVKGVVDAHGGEIRVESSHASGTSFIIEVPLQMRCERQ